MELPVFWTDTLRRLDGLVTNTLLVSASTWGTTWLCGGGWRSPLTLDISCFFSTTLHTPRGLCCALSLTPSTPVRCGLNARLVCVGVVCVVVICPACLHARIAHAIPSRCASTAVAVAPLFLLSFTSGRLRVRLRSLRALLRVPSGVVSAMWCPRSRRMLALLRCCRTSCGRVCVMSKSLPEWVGCVRRLIWMCGVGSGAGRGVGVFGSG